MSRTIGLLFPKVEKEPVIEVKEEVKETKKKTNKKSKEEAKGE